MISPGGNPVLESVAWALLHFVWQGTVVAALFWGARGALRRSSANARYLAGCAALALMAAMPVATVFRLAALPPSNSLSPVAAEIVSPALGGGESVGSGAAIAPGLSSRNPFRTLAMEGGEGATLAEGAAAVGLRLEAWLPWILVGWALGATILSLRLLFGWAYIQRLRHTLVHPVVLEWQVRLERIRMALGVRRPVLFLESVRIRVPCVVGWVRPAVLLPLSAMTGLSPSQLEAVVAHELAHIRRHDYLVNWLQSIVETLLFHHPAVWWISGCVREEREHCCDEQAVAVSGDRAEYVRSLVALEEARGAVGRLAPAATGGPLLNRVRRLLFPGQAFPVRPPGWMAGVAVLSLVAFLVLSPRTRSEAAGGKSAGETDLKTEGAASPSGVDPAPRLESPPEADDVASIPAEDRFAGGDPMKRYFLIGLDPERPAPPRGYRLLLVLPGGDGGPDFHPFVKRIHANSLDDRWLVAQLVAPRWSADQFDRIVWPTVTSPWPGMKCSTEAFIESVIDDVASRTPLDGDNIHALGWSSGGPPVYAESLNPTGRVRGSFIAMSVFKPESLPPLSNAAGRSYFLLYSPDDFIPQSMPEEARDALRRNGARVAALTYPGGHGWRGDVYGNLKTGIQWLESTRDPFREGTK